MAQYLPYFFSGFSLIISLLALYFAFKRTKIAESKEHDRQEEKLKAEIKPYIVMEHYSKGLRETLVIENVGKSEARNVKIKVNGEKPSESKTFQLQKTDVISTLGTKIQFKFPLTIYDQTKWYPWVVEIEWEDDFSENRNFKTEITK